MSQTQTSIVAWPYTPQQRNVTRVRVGLVPLLRPRLRSLLRCLVPRASCLKDAGPHSSPLATHVLRRHRALFFFSLLLLLSPVFSLKSVRLSHERKKEEKERKKEERERKERERESRWSPAAPFRRYVRVRCYCRTTSKSSAPDTAHCTLSCQWNGNLIILALSPDHLALVDLFFFCSASFSNPFAPPLHAGASFL